MLVLQVSLKTKQEFDFCLKMERRNCSDAINICASMNSQIIVAEGLNKLVFINCLYIFTLWLTSAQHSYSIYHMLVLWVLTIKPGSNFTMICQDDIMIYSVVTCSRHVASFESAWKQYQSLDRAFWVNIGRQNYSEAVDSCARTKSNVVVTENLSIPVFFNLFITPDYECSVRNCNKDPLSIDAVQITGCLCGCWRNKMSLGKHLTRLVDGWTWK